MVLGVSPYPCSVSVLFLQQNPQASPSALSCLLSLSRMPEGGGLRSIEVQVKLGVGLPSLGVQVRLCMLADNGVQQEDGGCPGRCAPVWNSLQQLVPHCGAFLVWCSVSERVAGHCSLHSASPPPAAGQWQQ